MRYSRKIVWLVAFAASFSLHFAHGQIRDSLPSVSNPANTGYQTKCYISGNAPVKVCLACDEFVFNLCDLLWVYLNKFFPKNIIAAIVELL